MPEISYTAVILLFSLIMLGFSILINGIMLKFASNLGQRKLENQIRWSKTSKPAIGGISFYIIYLISASASLLLSGSGDDLPYLKFMGVFAAVSAGFLMGLADDSYNTKPLLKFSVQFICAVIFLFTDNKINIFYDDWLNIGFTLLWVVGLMNSLNMLDNMDAITTSVAATILGGAMLYMVFSKTEMSHGFIVVLGVFVSMIGFLYYNWHPSRMYMGDSGSQFVGVFLAWVGVEYFWNAPDYFGQEIFSKQFLIPLLLFAVPIADTATVSINRMLKGKSPFVGGRDHTTHHLHYMGLSDRQVAILLTFISTLTMLAAIVIVNHIDQWNTGYFLLFGALFLIILIGLYSTTRIKSKNA